MECCCKRIFSKVRKSEQGRKTNASHSTAQSPFMRIESVWPDAFVSQKVEGFVFFCVVCFLKNRYIVGTAFMKVFVIFCVHRVDFQPNHAEIFSCDFAGLADVLNAAGAFTFACKNQNFFHATFGNYLHFVLNLLGVEHHPFYVIVAVEAAVNAVVFAIVGNVKRGEKIDCVSKVPAGFSLCFLGHLFKERFCCW